MTATTKADPTPPPRYLLVIALSAQVWDDPAFRAKNQRAAARRDAGEQVDAVYVGMSTHRAACRFAIHQGSRLCTCGLQPEGKVRFGMASHWVERFGVGVVQEIPVEGPGHPATVMAARALASKLRKAGVGVWQVP